MKRVVILIDGQNLFYALRGLDLYDRNVNWNKLFQSLLEPHDELLRVYWFRPQKLQDSHYTPEVLKKQIVYKHYHQYYSAYRKGEYFRIPESIMAGINEKFSIVERWLTEQRKRFISVELNYDQICLENSDIEIVKRGIVKINPYIREYIGEKGVDITLAVKMISLSVEKKCDKIILISGDYDYIEAINYVKNNMTKIHIVKIHKGNPPKNRNMSRDLSIMADKIIDIYEEELKNRFLKTAVTVS